MPTPKLDQETVQRAVAAWLKHGRSWTKAARSLGMSKATFQHRIERAQELGLVPEALRGTPIVSRAFEIDELGDEDPDAEELIERRIKDFQKRVAAEDERKLIQCRVNLGGPIGLAMFGDIHIDSPGCNWPLLKAHTKLVNETEGMFACSVGDLQDGWIGRLARLWAQQGISARQAQKLVHWWIDEIADKLLFLVQGNHDAWTRGVNGTGPIDWISAQAGVLTQNDGVRLAISTPSGQTFTVNCRHDMRGHSQYNKAHGMTKAAMFGWRDDILLAGHTHETGYNPVKDPMTGKVSHPVRVASYKHIDPYAKESGFPDANITECPVAILDPDEEDKRYRVHIDFNPFRAARMLKSMRDEWKAKNSLNTQKRPPKRER